MNIKVTKKNLLFNFIQLAVIIFLLVLPYYIFRDRLFVGGDDTRLFYHYPELWLEMIKSSWLRFSSTGFYSPNQFFYPLVFILVALKKFGLSGLIIQNTVFSLILILGMVFTQKTIKEIAGRQYEWEAFLASLFYIFSPILLVSQLSVYLYSVWLIVLMPILAYFFIRYVKEDKFIYAFYGGLSSVILSMAVASIPWFAGWLLPFLISLSLLFLFQPWRKSAYLIKKALVYIVLILVFSSFWIVPFGSQFFFKGDSWGGYALSPEVADTFSKTVNVISEGTSVFYPMLNLFHRKIQVDFNWQTKSLYSNFYDNFIFFNLIYPLVAAIGILGAIKSKNKILLFFAVSFLVSLLFFSVNVPLFKDLFLRMGNIPGFAMFRNFFDKFAQGYVWIYSLVIGLSLAQIKKTARAQIYRPLYLIVFAAILINAVPLFDGRAINKMLWTTQNTKITVEEIPKEYLDFAREIKKIVPEGVNVLGVPFNNAAYAILSGNNGAEAYVGTSPLVLFSGVNDLSGQLSMTTAQLSLTTAELVRFSILARDYELFKKVLDVFNVGFVMVTKNISQEVRKSYLFDSKLLSAQDSLFLANITGKEILKSRDGNYALYSLKSFPKEGLIKLPNKVYSFPSVNGRLTLKFVGEKADAIMPESSLKNPFLSEIIPVEIGKKYMLDGGKYSLAKSYPGVFVVDYKEGRIESKIIDGLKLAKDGKVEISESIKILADNLNGNEHLLVNGQPIALEQVKDLAVKKSDQILVQKANRLLVELKAEFSDENKIYVSGGAEFLLADKKNQRQIPFKFAEWSQMDCNSYDPSLKISFEDKGLGAVALTALDNHNACIYKSFEINPNNSYWLDFDFYSNNDDDVLAYIDVGNSFDPVIIKKNKSVSSKQHFSREFQFPPTNGITLYLYSGKQKNGEATTIYENIKFSYAPKSQTGLYLVKEPKKNIIPPDLESVKKEKSFGRLSYHVKINNASAGFLLNFLESFHDGWRIYFAKDGQLVNFSAGARQLIVNNYSNGWWLDVQEICQNQNLCEKNKNGYAMELVIDFWPQKLFYFGLAISAIFLIVSLFCLIDKKKLQFLKNVYKN